MDEVLYKKKKDYGFTPKVMNSLFPSKEIELAREVIRLCEHAFLTDFSNFDDGDKLEDDANKALYKALQAWSEIN